MMGQLSRFKTGSLGTLTPAACCRQNLSWCNKYLTRGPNKKYLINWTKDQEWPLERSFCTRGQVYSFTSTGKSRVIKMFPEENMSYVYFLFCRFKGVPGAKRKEDGKDNRGEERTRGLLMRPLTITAGLRSNHTRTWRCLDGKRKWMLFKSSILKPLWTTSGFDC